MIQPTINQTHMWLKHDSDRLVNDLEASLIRVAQLTDELFKIAETAALDDLLLIMDT